MVVSSTTAARPDDLLMVPSALSRWRPSARNPTFNVEGCHLWQRQSAVRRRAVGDCGALLDKFGAAAPDVERRARTRDKKRD